jgi:peptide chain release factor subunit 1
MAGVIDDVTSERLRSLAAARAPAGRRVLTIYFDLDPSRFATGEARATEISSVLDEAERLARSADGSLPHEGKAALRADVERVREWFGREFSAKGAHGLSLFACGPSGLFEALRLPCPAPRQVAVGKAPLIRPLAELGPATRWAVLLVNRRHGRLFSGTRWALAEAGDVYDREADRTRAGVREGGLSEMRYQRSVEEEAKHHFAQVSEGMLQRLKRRPFHRLLVAAPDPEYAEVVERLHPYVRERCAGRVDVDVEHATTDQVLEASAEAMRADTERRAAEALERLRAGIGRGDGAVHGHAAVHDALEQQRVEVLLYDARADTDLEEPVRAALLQSAEVINVGDAEDLAPLGHIAAVLRF